MIKNYSKTGDDQELQYNWRWSRITV